MHRLNPTVNAYGTINLIEITKKSFLLINILINEFNKHVKA